MEEEVVVERRAAGPAPTGDPHLAQKRPWTSAPQFAQNAIRRLR